VLPPDGVLAAAGRWIELLELGTSIERAWGVIRNAPAFAGLSATQYATALDWISSLGLLPELTQPGTAPASRLFTTAISALAPAWLTDADALLDDPADLPLDALRLADLFAVPEARILPLIQGIGRRTDPELAARIGLAGETALVALLNDTIPGCARHMSLTDDTLGYDITVTDNSEAHLEVKSTTRRGRLIIYLSRHEFEVAAIDDAWALVIVGLDADLHLAALATARAHIVHERVPHDVSRLGRWDSVAIELRADDLTQGLILGNARLSTFNGAVSRQAGLFAWMPPPA